ncbi:acyl-CoA dehydrogenase family protein [Micromonospora sp. WMMA1949]|uniref:acyl-CoA dehydrogenase family protein n=1 Tax=unclassified Micromonospora TaxID=2617518 RepID=UPI0022B63A8B|nr:acyl-CoA dehydrogenase family protein [Micromonospora sp. WMMA1949]MCZ7428582.1 acyl-CoA dehydrogenase family protein [Micromonospora sp. WMMA1949]
MDFSPTASDVEFRDRVRAVLAAPEAIELLADLAHPDPGERDERPLYRFLGAAGLLAPHWPRGYGGGGGDARCGVIALEELMRAGIPDTLLVNSILTVGQLILSCGRDDQRDDLLPRLARGEIFASILYTEPGAGSDLGALTTAAEPVTDGFRITGSKAFNLSERCDVGLCAARTSPASTRYDGLSLFLVDLRAPGVRIERMPSLPDEQFTLVHLDGVAVDQAALIGALDDGFALLTRALAFERTGFDFALRAARWFDLAGRATPDDPDELERTGRYGAGVAAARLLAWQASLAVAGGDADPTRAPVAKWYGSELAAAVATWALSRHGLDDDGRLPVDVDRAYREAPGLTLAGGTSEMMLRTLAEQLTDAVAAEG